MRSVVQRVTRAQVTVKEEVAGKIARGLLILLAVAATDEAADADYLADKITALRVFEDEAGKMNLSVRDVAGDARVVSQFTLLGDVRRGNRPSFEATARPERARELYEYFVARTRATGLSCQTGRFQETMEVELVNDGPVTILLDSSKTFQRASVAPASRRLS
jgi:D-tyrosyl-tRNA(Tyr) deacylase